MPLSRAWRSKAPRSCVTRLRNACGLGAGCAVRSCASSCSSGDAAAINGDTLMAGDADGSAAGAAAGIGPGAGVGAGLGTGIGLGACADPGHAVWAGNGAGGADRAPWLAGRSEPVPGAGLLAGGAVGAGGGAGGLAGGAA